MAGLPIQHTPQTFKLNINKADGFLSRDNYPAVAAFRLKAAGAAVGRLRRADRRGLRPLRVCRAPVDTPEVDA
jgi:hypothetical protein